MEDVTSLSSQFPADAMMNETPLRTQYLSIKKQYPDSIVLFRLGDFYETFDKDAELTSRLLEITLTSREMGKGNRVPMAGIPYHALDAYLGRLIHGGTSVAICEQTQQSGPDQGLLDRSVVRVITPGTVLESGILDGKINNYLVALTPGTSEIGLAYCDISTSEFATTQIPLSLLSFELERLNPAEILAPETLKYPLARPVSSPANCFLNETDSRKLLLEHFQVENFTAYGCETLPLAITAAATIIRYLQFTQGIDSTQLGSMHTYSLSKFMSLDSHTRRNLELFNGGPSGGPSLLSILDKTKTPMGARLFRQWLGQPLIEMEPLKTRQDAISWFHQNPTIRDQTAVLLAKIADIERIFKRIQLSIASPRELQVFRQSLEAMERLKQIIPRGSNPIGRLIQSGKTCKAITDLIFSTLQDNPSQNPGDGYTIKPGLSKALDEAKFVSSNARELIAKIEVAERENTGINSLKIGYNRIFGYYLEITRPHLDKIPDIYIRRQTLANAERFVTTELKEYENTILTAAERTETLEKELFADLCRQVAEFQETIYSTSKILSQIDCFFGMAETAIQYQLVRPTLTETQEISIVGGRHPIVEFSLPPGSFVPNDLTIGNNECSLMLLTGPNMAGKSTYIRQAAIITLMAQIGSFVPADSASIGLVDRIFTRVGLHDDLTAGQSTFMVEMMETAEILHHATKRSLVILDEIGRGTSTYDGLAIAWTIVRYLHNENILGCKTLFATHYHELTHLEKELERVKNYTVAVKEDSEDVIFLRQIIKGRSGRSYGIHVARLAGMPKSIIRDAIETLKSLEDNGVNDANFKLSRRTRTNLNRIASKENQMLLFSPLSDEILKELKSLDTSRMTPIDALIQLEKLHQKASE